MASLNPPASKPSVDDVWAKLKGSTGPKKVAGVGAADKAIDLDKLWRGFSCDASAGKSTIIKPVPQEVEPEVEQLICRSRTPAALTHAAGPEAGSGLQGCQQQPDPAAAEQLVNRCVASFKDSAGPVRRKALECIRDQILGNPHLSDAWLEDRLQQDLGKALLRRFEDAVEACRELAVNLLSQLLMAATSAVLSLLPYAFPVLGERLQHNEAANKAPVEPCEEVRLALARLLNTLVQLGDKAIGAYAGEAVALVGVLCADSYHEVQAEACAVVVKLNAVLGLRLQPVAKQLVADLLPMTTAKRHRVRVAALQALRVTMHQGAHEMILEMVAWRDPNVIPVKAFYGDDLKINFCGKLATDPHPQVRLEFLRTLSNWMTTLRERTDHESRLLPFVLSALNDDSPDIQAEAVQVLDALGQQYERDHEKDLKDTLTYLPEEAHGIGWQAEGAASHAYGCLAEGQGATVHGGRVVLVLPGPLRTRPRVGTRRMVQTNFGRVVGPLCEEVSTWLLDPRKRAAALLRTQLLLVEEWSGQHLHQLLPAMCKAIADPEVSAAIGDCCAILGCFVDPGLCLQLLAPRIEDDSLDLAQRASALRVLAGVIRGAGPRRALDPHMGQVVGLLRCEVLMKSEDTGVRRALLAVVQQLLDTCAPACSRHADQLLLICLHLRAPTRCAAAAASAHAASAAAAPEAGAMDVASCMEAVMAQLAEVCGCNGGVDELVGQHREELAVQVSLMRSSSMLVDTAVLARLLLPSGHCAGLLQAPEETAAKLLPPPPVPEGIHNAGLPPGEGDRSATAFWPASSTAPVLGHVVQQLPALASHARCALLLTLSLEACLERLPTPGGAGAEEQQRALAQLLEQLMACSLLVPAQLPALRCAHIAVCRGLLPSSMLAHGLLKPLAEHMDSSSTAACRMQACYTLQALANALGSDGAVQLLEHETVVAAVKARLMDASDGVRAAAGRLLLGLLRQYEAQRAAGAAGRVASAAHGLVTSVGQVVDVIAGSDFQAVHRELVDFVEQNMEGA